MAAVREPIDPGREAEAVRSAEEKYRDYNVIGLVEDLKAHTPDETGLTYQQLQRTPDQERVLTFYNKTLALGWLISIGANKNEMEKQAPILGGLHPLKNLAFLLSTPELRKNFQTVFGYRWFWPVYIVKSKYIEGMAIALQDRHEKGFLEPHLPAFVDELMRREEELIGSEIEKVTKQLSQTKEDLEIRKELLLSERENPALRTEHLLAIAEELQEIESDLVEIEDPGQRRARLDTQLETLNEENRKLQTTKQALLANLIEKTNAETTAKYPPQKKWKDFLELLINFIPKE